MEDLIDHDGDYFTQEDLTAILKEESEVTNDVDGETQNHPQDWVYMGVNTNFISLFIIPL